MKNILVPTDGSELSGYALKLAQMIAQTSGAKVFALKVIPTPADAVFNREGELLEAEDFNISTVNTQKKAGLIELTSWLESRASPAIPIVKSGNLIDQILFCINKEKIDLVVMGTHGLHGIRELIADSVTGLVVRSSAVPVLSLKCDRSDLEIENILFANSFEWDTPPKIPLIKELLETFQANLHLLRVNTPGHFKTTRFLEEKMKAFAEINGLKNVHHHIYCDKEIEDGILGFVEQKGMDMISIGVEENSFAKLFQKHISSSLVNHVYYPVLTFKI